MGLIEHFEHSSKRMRAMLALNIGAYDTGNEFAAHLMGWQEGIILAFEHPEIARELLEETELDQRAEDGFEIPIPDELRNAMKGYTGPEEELPTYQMGMIHLRHPDERN